MSEFVAGAFVDVRPDARGFRTDLKKKLDDAVKNTKVTIPVELDPKRFKSTVQNAARQAPAKIPIEPGTTVADLRKAILDKVNRATTGIKIKVPIEVVDARTTAGKAKATQGEGAVKAADKTAVQGTSAVKASDQVTESTKKQKKAKDELSATDRALKKSTDELLIAQRLLDSSNDASLSNEERAVRVREARSAAGRGAKATNDLLATSAGKLSDAEREALEVENKRATTFRQGIIAKQQDLALTTAQDVTTRKSTDARTQATQVMSREVKQIRSLNALREHENEVTSAEAALKRQSKRARDQGLTSLARENDLLLTSIERRKQDIATQRAALKGESRSARQQRTAGRGAASTLLSLLGIRGATLAASGAFLAGAVAAASFAKSIQSFVVLETELNVFQATAGATAEQMKEVAKVASNLGRDVSLPGVTAADAAQAMSELARAGLSVQDAMSGARGVLELAAAAQISNAEAATFTASALNAFNLEGEEAARVVDLLANAANASQGSISEFGAAMQQALAIAKLVGFTIEDTIAQLTIFAQNGLRGSDAGTSLRTALSRLIAPTKKAAELIDALGINLRDAEGNLRTDIFVQFGEATKNISPALRDMIAQTIAGQDAIRAFAIGAEEGRRGLQRAQLQMEVTGSAAALAGARAKGLGGQFKALGSQVQTLGTTFGGFAAKPVGAVVSGLNDIFTALNQISTGDFDGLFRDTEEDFDQFAANMVRKGKALNKIFDPFGGQQREGLKELFTNAPPVNQEAARIEELKKELADLQNLRLQTFDVTNAAAIAPLTEKIKALRKELQAAKIDAGLIIPVTALEKATFPLRQARKAAQDLKKDLLSKGASPAKVQFLDDLIRNFNVRIKLIVKSSRDAARNAKEAMKKELTSSEIAAQFTEMFALIAREPDLATPEILGSFRQLAAKIEGTAPLTGAAGKKVGKALMDNLNAAIRAALEDDNTDLAAELQAFADKIANLFGISMANSFKNLKLPLTQDQILDSLLPERIKSARAEAFGTIDEQIAAKEEELAGLRRGLNKVIKGSEDEEAILQAIQAKKNEIRGLREQQASDEKEANQRADKKISDAQDAQEQKLQNNLSVARTTEGLKNDIRAQIALRDFYRRQIQIIKTTVRDAETRAELLKEAEQNLFEIEQDLAESRAGRRQQIRDVALKGIDDAAERAAETESLKDDVRVAQRKVAFWRNQVKVIKQLVKDRKATADELQDAQDELDAAEADLRSKRRERRDQKNEQRQESLELDIEFASINENRNAEIAARRAFIKFLEQQIRAVKGNVLKVKQLRNQIAEQKKAIKELEGEAKDADATSAFEILQQNAETFKKSGGNLISGNQPFAGAAGFTADTAQFLFRQERSRAKAEPLPTTKTSGALDRNDRAHFRDLTNAVVDLTRAIRNPGEGKVPGKNKSTTDRNDRAHFPVATASRQVVERRSGI